METFRKSFRALARAGAGRPRLRQRDEVFFSSIEAARKLLTPKRLALLRVIRVECPPSIYSLAQLVGCDLKNVQQDLRLLESYGLVRVGQRGRGRAGRNRKAPRVMFDQIALKIAI